MKLLGGGGRLRHATGRMKKENVRWVLAVIKAKAVVVTSACLHLCIVLLRSLSLLNIVKYVILTNTPDWKKTDRKVLIIETFDFTTVRGHDEMRREVNGI